MLDFRQFRRTTFLAVALACCGCASTPHVQVVESEKMLLGRITEEELYGEFPEFAANRAAYQPDRTAIRQIANADSAELILFLGTWCEDLLSEVPKMLKVLAAAGNPRLELTMFALDHSKRDRRGFAQSHRVEFVPTLIVMRNGRDLGRIVEYPKVSVETDLAEILAGRRP